MNENEKPKKKECGDSIIKAIMVFKCIESVASVAMSFVVAIVIGILAFRYFGNQNSAFQNMQANPIANLEYACKADSRLDFFLKENEIEGEHEFQSAALSYMAEIEILHVGQGGCVVLRDGTICTLIDVGGAEDGSLIGAHLNDLGVSEIDVVLTTADSRHCGGLDVLADWVDIQKVYTTSKIANDISLSGYAVEEISQCSSWRTGAYIFQCLASDDVAVMRVTLGNHSLVYLSNLTAEHESEFLEARFAGMDVSADFLVASSHGESDTNSEQLLAAIGASQNFIQMDEDEAVPCLTTINRLHKFAVTWRTDRFDTCVIHTDGVDYTMRQDSSRNCNG